jgi:hypothetical protein
MSYSNWLHNKTSMHRDARQVSKLKVTLPTDGLDSMHLVTLAQSNQMSMEYVIPPTAPQSLFAATKDANMRWWGLYEYPVI